jgi:hypothetical protein
VEGGPWPRSREGIVVGTLNVGASIVVVVVVVRVGRYPISDVVWVVINWSFSF